MKIERPWLRIIVSAIVGGIAALGLFEGGGIVAQWQRTPGPQSPAWWPVLFLSLFLIGPIIAIVLAHTLTPKERLDGETRCRKCGYILKGLTEPRCSECGERI